MFACATRGCRSRATPEAKRITAIEKSLNKVGGVDGAIQLLAEYNHLLGTDMAQPSVDLQGDLTVFIQSNFAGLKQQQIKSIQKQQRRILDILDKKQVPYQVQDISATTDAGAQMRLLAGPTALAPQIAKGHQYCGNHASFEKALAEQTLDVFLGVPVRRKHAERKLRTIRRRELAANASR
jgi:hypothetical protein